MDKLHPAVTVTNIRNFIPVTLEMSTAQYSTWAELFKVHCLAHQALDHILPEPPAATTPSGGDKPADKVPEKPVDKELWKRIDAIVCQWIYGTISSDLLHTILKPGSTAAQAWKSLANIFQDNANSRALFLQTKLTNIKLSSFPDVSSYCQEIKVLADQLANVKAPVPDQTLVLHLIAGLTDQYDGVATILQQQDPLPDFYAARSKLIMEEARKAHQNQTPAALVAATPPDSSRLPPPFTTASASSNSSPRGTLLGTA